MDSYASARNFFKLISAALVPGGYFVGTCTDDLSLLSKLVQARGPRFGNKYYQVKFEDDEYKDLLEYMETGEKKDQDRIFK